MTPEERAARATLDSPYRTPRERIAREIHEALSVERARLAETLDGYRARLQDISAVLAAGDIEQARDRLKAIDAELSDVSESWRRL